MYLLQSLFMHQRKVDVWMLTKFQTMVVYQAVCSDHIDPFWDNILHLEGSDFDSHLTSLFTARDCDIFLGDRT